MEIFGEEPHHFADCSVAHAVRPGCRPTVHDPDFRVLSVLAGQPPGMKGSDSWSDRARRELPSKRIFHAGDGEPLVLAELDGSGPAGAGLSEPRV
jgi:hypothetical protein